MKNIRSFVLGMAACALVASTLIAAAPSPQQAAAPQAQAAADDPAAPVFAETCGKCHDAARIVAMRRTSAEWEDIIKKMIEKGAPGTEKDFETVYDYLLRHHGKLNINAAPPTEMVTILGLSPKEAEGIVAQFDRLRWGLLASIVLVVVHLGVTGATVLLSRRARGSHDALIAAYRTGWHLEPPEARGPDRPGAGGPDRPGAGGPDPP